MIHADIRFPWSYLVRIGWYPVQKKNCNKKIKIWTTPERTPSWDSPWRSIPFPTRSLGTLPPENADLIRTWRFGALFLQSKKTTNFVISFHVIRQTFRLRPAQLFKSSFKRKCDLHQSEVRWIRSGNVRTPGDGWGTRYAGDRRRPVAKLVAGSSSGTERRPRRTTANEPDHQPSKKKTKFHFFKLSTWIRPKWLKHCTFYFVGMNGLTFNLRSSPDQSHPSFRWMQ